MSGKILTGAGTCLAAAHRSRDGRMHGHTWEIVAWWIFDGTDATARQAELIGFLSAWDHDILPDELAWGENLAAWIGSELGCFAVDVSRPSERIFARWQAS